MRPDGVYALKHLLLLRIILSLALFTCRRGGFCLMDENHDFKKINYYCLQRAFY